MVQLAGDMALEQAQATDEFFTDSTAYTGATSTGSEDPYTLKLSKNGTFQDLNFYEEYTGFTNKEDIYKSLFNYNLESYVVNNPSILDIASLVGRYDTVSNSIVWYSIPSIAQMGYDLLGNTDAFELTALDGSVRTESALSDIISMYELSTYKKTIYVNSNETMDIYYTPLSQGITYLDEDLVGTLFIANMDLLMRAKYMQSSGYDLTDSKYGDGVLTTSFYSDMVDTTSLDLYNPINNGSFTLLRGSNAGMSNYLYSGMTPKIEYKVIDMYDDNNNNLLKLLFGPFLKENNAEVTGSNFKSLDIDQITYFESVTNTMGQAESLFDTKPIVLAKVTFYADIIIPYQTVLLREMKGREDSGGSIGSRNVVVGALSELTNALPGNFVDVERYTESRVDEYYNGAYNLGSANNSDAFMYTTFFAVTP